MNMLATLSPAREMWLVAVSAAATTDCAKAVGAVDGLVAAWHEGHLGVLATVGTDDFRHGALAAAIATTAAAAVAAAVATAVAVVAIATAVAVGFLGGAAIGATTRLCVALLGEEVLLAFGECERITAIAAR